MNYKLDQTPEQLLEHLSEIREFLAMNKDEDWANGIDMDLETLESFLEGDLD